MPLTRADRPQLERLLAWERASTLSIHRRVSSRPSMRLFAAVSRLGDGPLWYALIVGLAAFGGSAGRLCAVHMLAAGAFALMIYLVLKRAAGRPRPCFRLNGIELCVKPRDEFSFPSGHTLHAVSFAIIVSHYFPGAAWALVPFAMLTAVSRVALGLHYPSDVLAGIAVGVATATASFWFV